MSDNELIESCLREIRYDKVTIDSLKRTIASLSQEVEMRETHLELVQDNKTSLEYFEWKRTACYEQ